MSDNGAQPSEENLGAAVNSLAEGQKAFGRYTLMKIVGRSAVSVVWLAWDEKRDRDVALKFLPEMTKIDASAVATLKREIRKLAENLKHDKIIQVFDLEQDGGLAAIPMEYVEGTSLATLRAQKDSQVFAPQDLTDWMQQLCEVLEYAHNEANTCHGDLKPTNLILNQKGVLKVADFALEPFVTEFLSRTTTLANGGRNPAYWSPQRASGQPATPQDDIYSIGATAYEMLTSKPPFYTGDIMLQVNQKVPPPMVHRRKELRVIGEPISRLWEETVAACLSKDPAQRPQTIGQVVERLELEAPPSVELQEKPATAPAKPASHNNILVIAISAAVIVLLGVVGLMIGRGGKSADQATGGKPPPPVIVQDTAAIASAEKARKDAEAAAKAAKEQAVKLQAEADRLKQAEAARLVQAEKDRREAETKRLAAEAEAKRLAEEVEKAKKAALLSQSEAEAKALKEAEAKVKAAQDEAKRLQMAIDKANADAAKKAVDAEKARKDTEAKKTAALAEAQRLAALQASMVAEQAKLEAETKRKAEEAKRQAEEAAKQEAARKVAQQKAAADALARRKFVPGKPWENSLGMRFVPVGDAVFCIWECRVQDYDAFVRASRYDAGRSWNSPGFKQDDSCPVVNVNWNDAQAFCKWLSDKERTEGLLADYAYRLPTDVEWSQAVGLVNEPGSTPAERHGKVRAIYPWGAAWPPPAGAGNYANNISYDRFDNTSPVASFMPNQFGIYDMGGNVWEWCQEPADSSQANRVLRGGAYTGYAPGALYSSYRLMIAPGDRRPDSGFRCVLSKAR